MKENTNSLQKWGYVASNKTIEIKMWMISTVYYQIQNYYSNVLYV